MLPERVGDRTGDHPMEAMVEGLPALIGGSCRCGPDSICRTSCVKGHVAGPVRSGGSPRVGVELDHSVTIALPSSPFLIHEGELGAHVLGREAPGMLHERRALARVGG